MERSPVEYLRSGYSAGLIHLTRYMRHKRAPTLQNFLVMNGAFIGTHVDGFHAQQWAKMGFQTGKGSDMRNPGMASTLLGIYELLEGAVSWSWGSVNDTGGARAVPKPTMSLLKAKVGDRVEVVPKESISWWSMSRPETIVYGTLLADKMSIRLDNGKVVPNIPPTQIFAEDCFSPVFSLPTWRCLNKRGCSKLNDARAIECSACKEPFLLHQSATLATEDEIAAVRPRRKAIGLEPEDKAATVALANLMLHCRVLRSYALHERAIITAYPPAFEAEIEALLLVLHWLTAVACGSLSYAAFSQKDQGEARSLLQEIPQFPYDYKTSPIHERGHFSFDHGLGFVFLDKLIAVCSRAVQSNVWNSLQRHFFYTTNKTLVTASDVESALVAVSSSSRAVARAAAAEEEDELAIGSLLLNIPEMFSDERRTCLDASPLVAKGVSGLVDLGSAKPLDRSLKRQSSALSQLSVDMQIVVEEASRFIVVTPARSGSSDQDKPVEEQGVADKIAEVESKVTTFLESRGEGNSAADILDDMKTYPLKLTLPAAGTDSETVDDPKVKCLKEMAQLLRGAPGKVSFPVDTTAVSNSF